MSEHDHPVTITDRRTKHQEQAEQDLRADHPGHGEETAKETDENRAARVKSALLDGKSDTLSDDDKQWFLAQQEETDLPDETRSVRAAFVVVIEHNGNAIAAPLEFLDSVEPESAASFDDMYAAVCLVKRDLDARQVSGTVMMEMQRQAQQMAQQQQRSGMNGFRQ